MELVKFEIGDIVKGCSSGNLLKVLDIDYKRGSFSGTIIEKGHNTMFDVGYFDDDWAVEFFELHESKCGFWNV